MRVTVEEETQDCGIRRAAPACLWPVYTRRLFFGGRPIVARADETIREHCRLRGLLKHHFASIRAAGKTEELEQMYNTDSEFSVKRIIKSCLIPQPRGIILQD